MAIPYNMDYILSRVPHGIQESSWTEDQSCAVETLREVWAQVGHGAWGTDDDWALLETLFTSGGKYIG